MVMYCGISSGVDLYDEALEKYRKGKFSEAIDVLTKKTQMNSGDHNLLGWSFLKSGKVDESIIQFELSILLNPSLSNSFCGLGYSYFRKGFFNKALENFNKGISLDIGDRDCLQGKDLALKKLEEAKGGDRTIDQVPIEIVSAKDSLYEEAVKSYRRGEFEKAIIKLNEALRFKPESVSILTLLGWSYYKNNDYPLAEQYFRQALSLDSNLDDAKFGLANTSLHYDRPHIALPLLLELTRKNPDNHELQLALAEAYFKEGSNILAAKIYRSLIEQGVMADIARERFLTLYGYPEYNKDIKLEPGPLRRPVKLEYHFRANGDYLEVREKEGWRRVYLNGVNIGPARPGEFPSTPPLDVSTYLDWLEKIAEMDSNMVRVYTILPPAFYQALKVHNERSSKKLWLIQEVWLEEKEEEKNLYEKSWTEDFKREIRDAIDIIHGQANIPYRRGHASGVFLADVSSYVFAIGVGREVEPSIVLVTNDRNPSKTKYRGRFINVERGNPSEVWFAEMCDLTIQYEVQKYKTMRPITLINWPPLDPMYHVTESTYAEELKIRKERGEVVNEVVKGYLDDFDVVTLDVRNFIVGNNFPPGVFASYHVYTYWPDFLIYDPLYPQARDHLGNNRYFGYLLDLKKHHRGMPLLIAEYGVPTSWGVAHIHPDGWHNGGISEKAQAEILVRMTQNIRDSGCAGGVVFEWQDEWWKRVSDLLTKPFAKPFERKPLWLNMMDPEQFFGILGYRSPAPVPLLRGQPADWEKAKHLISIQPPEKTGTGTIQQIYTFLDPAFLYLRLDVTKAKGQEMFPKSEGLQYWIAINTLPGKTGSRKLPDLNIDLMNGANFLIKLTGIDSSRIYISQNYNPNKWILNPAIPGKKRVGRKENMQVKLEDSSPFEEIIIEANQPRYGRDGSVFPTLFFNRSLLKFGTADPSSPDYSNLIGWSMDAEKGMIELRIPWGLIYVMDPSSRFVFSGTNEERDTMGQETQGVTIMAMVVEKKESEIHLVQSIPPEGNGKIEAGAVPIYTWQKWNRVNYEAYLKTSYFALKKIFGEINVAEGKSTVKGGVKK